jgi:hypothetical protein
MATFRVKALKAILKSFFFRPAVALNVFISCGCNLFSGVFIFQYPCPPGDVFQIVLVIMAEEMQRAAITDIVKLAAWMAVMGDLTDLMFHKPFLSSSVFFHPKT